VSIPGVPSEPAEGFEFTTVPPEVTFTVRDVAPPGAAYVGPAGALRVLIWSAQPGVEALMTVRTLMPDGQIQWSQYRFSPPGDYSGLDEVLPLSECFLLGLNIGALGVAKPGGFYVLVLLLHAPRADAPQAQMLVSGYLVSGSSLTYPNPRFVGPAEGPGRIRVIDGTDPAAGQVISETVPNGARWKLLAVGAALATSATAGNRSPYLDLLSATSGWWRSVLNVAQPASTTYYYRWAIGVPARGPSGPFNFVQDALPDQVALVGGWSFQIYHHGAQAGDDWGMPVYYVEEWIER